MSDTKKIEYEFPCGECNKDIDRMKCVEHNVMFCEKTLAEHDKQIRAELLDRVAEKIREHSGLHYVDCDGYFGGTEELIFKVDDWLDDIIAGMKAEVSNE